MRDRFYDIGGAIGLILILVGSFLLAIYIADHFAHAETPTYSKKYTVELICAITDKAPYYNCNEKWGLVIHDMWAIQCLGDNYWTIGGCAVWGMNVQDECVRKAFANQTLDEGCQRLVAEVDLWGKKYIEISTITKDSYGNSLVWHELKHLMCECNWHKDLIPNDPLEQFERLKKA